MKVLYMRQNAATDSQSMIHVEPESDRDRATLDAISKECQSIVIGFGRDFKTGHISHMQLRVATKERD